MPFKDPEVRRRYFRELMRRRRAGQQAKPKPSAKDARIHALEAELTQAHKRITELEQRGITRGHREERSHPVEFTEIGRLRAEIGRLKSDITKLRMMLQEEPDATKLRKKVIDQQVQVALLRRELRMVVKERNEYRVRVKAYKQLKHQEARRLLTGPNYRGIVKALHSDRAKHVTAAELVTAERLFIALRPLFIED
jgi:hypothetical protein